MDDAAIDTHSLGEESNDQQQQQDSNKPVVSPFQQVAEICTEELFGWMPLVDLHSVGQTCKRMQELAAYFELCWCSCCMRKRVTFLSVMCESMDFVMKLRASSFVTTIGVHFSSQRLTSSRH